MGEGGNKHQWSTCGCLSSPASPHPPHFFFHSGESKERRGVGGKKKIKRLAPSLHPSRAFTCPFYRQLISPDHVFPLHNFFSLAQGVEHLIVKEYCCYFHNRNGASKKAALPMNKASLLPVDADENVVPNFKWLFLSHSCFSHCLLFIFSSSQKTSRYPWKPKCYP